LKLGFEFFSRAENIGIELYWYLRGKECEVGPEGRGVTRGCLKGVLAIAGPKTGSKVGGFTRCLKVAENYSSAFFLKKKKQLLNNWQNVHSNQKGHLIIFSK
jgi:hypothetical protein